jgi:hypothetical protein
MVAYTMSAGVDFSTRLVTRNLRRLLDQVEVGVEEASGWLGMSPTEFHENLARPEGPELKVLDLLTDRLNLPLDSLFHGVMDIKSAKRWIKGDFRLPERYCTPAGSRVRTALPILEYLRSFWGERAYRSVFRELGVHENALSNPDALVSIRLVDDVCSLLAARGFGASDFVNMGQHVTAISANDPLRVIFSNARNIPEVYELAEEYASKYDVNFNYRVVRAKPGLLQFACSPKPEMADAFKTNIFQSRSLQLYRVGAIMGQPKYIGQKPPRIDEIQNIFDGAVEDIYSIAW